MSSLFAGPLLLLTTTRMCASLSLCVRVCACACACARVCVCVCACVCAEHRQLRCKDDGIGAERPQFCGRNSRCRQPKPKHCTGHTRRHFRRMRVVTHAVPSNITHTHTDIHTHTQTHTDIHTDTHRHRHIHTDTEAHTHTHTLSLCLSVQSPHAHEKHGVPKATQPQHSSTHDAGCEHT